MDADKDPVNSRTTPNSSSTKLNSKLVPHSLQKKELSNEKKKKKMDSHLESK